MNHPVGFLSRVDGSRSRIKACGLLRASIMTQSTIHLAPTLAGHEENLFLSLPLVFSFPRLPFLVYLLCLCLLSLSCENYMSARVPLENSRPRRQEICGFSRDRLIYTVSSRSSPSRCIFFFTSATSLYLYLLVLLLLLPRVLLLCDRTLAKSTSAALTRAFA